MYIVIGVKNCAEPPNNKRNKRKLDSVKISGKVI